jgi:hypothetical protein
MEPQPPQPREAREAREVEPEPEPEPEPQPQPEPEPEQCQELEPEPSRPSVLTPGPHERRHIDHLTAAEGQTDDAGASVSQEPEPEPEPAQQAEGIPPPAAGDERLLLQALEPGSSAAAFLIHVLRSGDQAQLEALASRLENRDDGSGLGLVSPQATLLSYRQLQ